MRTHIFFVFLFLSLTLTACRSSISGDQSFIPAETLSATAKGNDSIAATASLEKGSSTSFAFAKCTVVSREPTPGPTQPSLFAPVTERDWVRGEATAAVTIIEYGDFQ